MRSVRARACIHAYFILKTNALPALHACTCESDCDYIKMRGSAPCCHTGTVIIVMSGNRCAEQVPHLFIYLFISCVKQIDRRQGGREGEAVKEREEI